MSEKEWPAASVELRSIDELIPYARNARTHSPEQVDQLAASIKEWGWTNPVLVAEDDTIIAGHGRIMAARKLGLATVPAMIARGWSEAQKRAYVLADNKLALNAGWNTELLKVELQELDELGFAAGLIGFDPGELSALLGLDEVGEPAPPPEDPGAYQEQYGVIVVCSTEDQQREAYERLTEMGYSCKVVTT